MILFYENLWLHLNLLQINLYFRENVATLTVENDTYSTKTIITINFTFNIGYVHLALQDSHSQSPYVLCLPIAQ